MQSGDSKGLTILGLYGESTIRFDIVMHTTRGAVYVACFACLERTNGAEISGANPSPRLRKMPNLAAHCMLGHKSEDSTR
jgi:hypothetical protein